MSRASRKPVSGKVDKEIKENFSSLISSLNNSTQIQQFFSDFLTEEEQTMLSKRIMLHLMLERGYKSSQIQAFLGINKDTVRIHKTIWERGSNVYKNVLRVIAKKAEAREFWEKLEKFFTPIELFAKSRHDMRERAKFASGEWE